MKGTYPKEGCERNELVNDWSNGSRNICVSSLSNRKEGSGEETTNSPHRASSCSFMLDIKRITFFGYLSL